MNSNKYQSINNSADSLEVLHSKLSDAAVVLMSNDAVILWLYPFCAGSSVNPKLLDQKKIDYYFSKGDLNKIADVVILTTFLLYKFRNVLSKDAGVLMKTYEILDLAIQSNAFQQRRHPHRFWSHQTNLDKIVRLKDRMESHQRRLLDKEEAKTRFFTP